MKNMFWRVYVNAMFMEPPKIFAQMAERRGTPVSVPTVHTLLAMCLIAMLVMGIALMLMGLV